MGSNSSTFELTELELESIVSFLKDVQENKSPKNLSIGNNIGLNTLITQLNQTVNALDIRMQNYEKALKLHKHTEEIGKIGGWELNVNTGNLLWTNETFKILEVEKKENQSPNLPEGLSLFTKKSTPIIELAVKKAIELGESYSLEVEALTAKGNTKWVYTNGKANIVDGKIVSIFGTIQDISDRKNVEIESKLASDSLGFGTWNFDVDTKSLKWDDKMYSLYEVAPEEFEGAYMAWENRLSEKDKKRAVLDLEEAIKTGKEFNSEFAIVLKNGNEKFIAGKGIVLRNENGISTKMIGVNWILLNAYKKNWN